MKALLFVLLSAVVLIMACTSDSADMEFCDVEIVDSVSFALDVVPILETYCYFPNADGDAGCHVLGTAASGSGIYYVQGTAFYNGVKEKVDDASFENRVFEMKDMPPSNTTEGPSSIGVCDLEKLQAWIDEGAQNN